MALRLVHEINDEELIMETIAEFMQLNPVAVDRAMQGSLHQVVRDATVLTVFVDEAGKLVQVKHDLTFDERQRISRQQANQKEERAIRRFSPKMPKLWNQSLGLGRDVLSSAVFRAGNGARAALDVELTTFTGTTLHYRGPELRQNDARVLKFLIHDARKEGAAGATVAFNPMAFVTHMGWDPHIRSVTKLRQCIERMQGSVLRISVPGAFLSSQLVGTFAGTGDEWTVQLHSDVLGVFAGGAVFLPMAEQTVLIDGLQTWLAGFLRANYDETTFDMAALQLHSGGSGKLKEFAFRVRAAMSVLRREGAVLSFDCPRGKLRVERVPPDKRPKP